MKVNGQEQLIKPNKPGRETMYLTHEAKGHEIRWPWAKLWQQALLFHSGKRLLPTGLEVPLGAARAGFGTTGHAAVVMLACGACRAPTRTWGPASSAQVSTWQWWGVGRRCMPQRRPCTSPVVIREVALFTSWMALFNCGCVNGHDSAHAAK